MGAPFLIRLRAAVAAVERLAERQSHHKAALEGCG